MKHFSVDASYPPVSDETAKNRLAAFARKNGYGPHPAGFLSEIIWPDRKWRSAQGAGGAAGQATSLIGGGC